MDLATRKKQFITAFEKISDEEKITEFEKLLKLELDKDRIVTHTASGRPVSLEEYKMRNRRAKESFENGEFKTSAELLKKFSKSE